MSSAVHLENIAMQRTKWTNRKFTFNIPAGWMQNIFERLRGTELRLRALVDGLPDDRISFKPNGKWSIKEHIGHLSDLEELHALCNRILVLSRGGMC